MTFPTVVATNTGPAGAASASANVNLPAGIAANDICIVHVAIEDTNSNVVWPAGWTELWDLNGVSNVGQAVAWRRCDGAEGSTISVSWGATRSPDFRSLLIRGANLTQSPEGTATSGTNESADPPNLAPAWPTSDTLWIACACAKWTNAFSGYPANYTDNQYQNPWTTVGGITVNSIMANRSLRAASENPGAFTTTFGGTMTWRAGVVAIRGTGQAAGQGLVFG